jgi:23S rRNA (cytidine1920-2'-O)/16S rRNA (cytidine1409-2'-O)-methyltransferase
MPLRRLDAELVRRGLATSQEEARNAVDAGLVTIEGVTATKVATMVSGDSAVALTGSPPPFVSRGGRKLAAALDRFAIDPSGRDALDAGSSTGGFTDCLLQRGASRVVAVDVGYGQLAWDLRSNARVVVLERTNVRDLTPEMLPFVPDLVVADLSFISLQRVLGALARLATTGADHIVLVKPQFEAGRDEVGSGGVVRDPDVWRRAVTGVAEAGRSVGLEPQAVIASPLTGPAGNVEFLLLLTGRGAVRELDLNAAIAEGEALLR